MISIVIPCYNVEKKIDACINSILNQTYSDFEIIAIDDGSKDNTFEKLKSYEKTDGRVKAFTQKNRGPSATRNKGIELAKGEYIAFCDSDDYVGEQYLEHLYEHTKNNCDIVIAGFNYASTEGEITRIPGISFSCDKKEFLEKYYAENISRRLIFGPINKLYKKTLLEEKNIRFDTRIKIREDGLFVFEYLKCCNTFEGIEDAEYYYVQYAENASLISKLNEEELHINARFYKTMVLLKEHLTKKDVQAICPIFLNMDISLIKKYYREKSPTYLEGIRYIKEIHRDETFKQARHMLRKCSWQKALRYYCPSAIEALVKRKKQIL